jgi:eukaryotic-like serine/threonine-protein kinase
MELDGKAVAGKYELGRLLGIGGMGAVYEATHSVTRRSVALKIIHSAVMSPRAGARFLREAQAAAMISHPAIVDVLDAGQLPDGTHYLAFELLEGEDLERALNKRAMSLAELREIWIEVLDVLATAHAAGFVHRDIKPSNIFLLAAPENGRRIKLLDFGVAKCLQDSGAHPTVTAHGAMVGTLAYASPEQVRGERVDARADIWSIGVLMYRALAGQSPFGDGAPLELLQKIAFAPVPPLNEVRPDVPAALAKIIARALEKDAGARWPNAREMRDALRAIEIPISPLLSLGGTTRDLSATQIENLPLVTPRRFDARTMLVIASAMVMIFAAAAVVSYRAEPPTPIAIEPTAIEPAAAPPVMQAPSAPAEPALVSPPVVEETAKREEVARKNGRAKITPKRAPRSKPAPTTRPAELEPIRALHFPE